MQQDAAVAPSANCQPNLPSKLLWTTNWHFEDPDLRGTTANLPRSQDTAQRRIVVGRESGAQVRMHNAKMEVRSGSRTIEEQQPTLEILDMGDLVHQSVVFDRQLRQLSAHIVRVSQRRPQDSDPLL